MTVPCGPGLDAMPKMQPPPSTAKILSLASEIGKQRRKYHRSLIRIDLRQRQGQIQNGARCYNPAFNQRRSNRSAP